MFVSLLITQNNCELISEPGCFKSMKKFHYYTCKSDSPITEMTYFNLTMIKIGQQCRKQYHMQHTRRIESVFKGRAHSSSNLAADDIMFLATYLLMQKTEFS